MEKENVLNQIMETTIELDSLTDELEKLIGKQRKLQNKVIRTQRLLDPAAFNTKVKIKNELFKRIPHTVQKLEKIKQDIEMKKIRINTLSKNLIALQSILKHLDDRPVFQPNFEKRRFKNVWKRS